MLFAASGTFDIQTKTPDKTYALGSVVVSDTPVKESYAAQFAKLQTHSDTVASVEPLRSLFSKEPDKQITLTAELKGAMSGMMPGMTMGEIPKDGIEWEEGDMQMMNTMSDTTAKKNTDIDWTFKKGEPVKIRIFNDPNAPHPMQHPIHFHGQRFLVVARDGVQQTDLVWKDTVLVKAGETVDIVLDTSNPGVWMAHCHIAEHLEARMMFKFKVE